jgi:hypothetical protein
MSHKGSWSRVNNHKDWADNYEQIFRKKPNQTEEITQTKQKHEHTTKHNEENRTMALTGSQTNSNASS